MKFDKENIKYWFSANLIPSVIGLSIVISLAYLLTSSTTRPKREIAPTIDNTTPRYDDDLSVDTIYYNDSVYVKKTAIDTVFYDKEHHDNTVTDDGHGQDSQYQ